MSDTGWPFDAVPRGHLRVVAAAIQHPDGRVFTVPAPGRHADVLWMMRDMGCLPGNSALGGEQGFILSNGHFVRRKPAASLAIINRQIPALKWPPNLYSEDVW